MRFCKKCNKQSPTTAVFGVEECMVCGSKFENEPKKEESFTNKAMAKNLKDIKRLTKKDSETGKYTNAQIVGRNISIGLFIILIGIMYAIGGTTLVFWGIAILVVGLFVASVFIYIAAMQD